MPLCPRPCTTTKPADELSSCFKSKQIPSRGVGDGVGAGEGDSASCSRVLRFLPSCDLAITTWALRASCSRDLILSGRRGREKHKRGWHHDLTETSSSQPPQLPAFSSHSQRLCLPDAPLNQGVSVCVEGTQGRGPALHTWSGFQAQGLPVPAAGPGTASWPSPARTV